MESEIPHPHGHNYDEHPPTSGVPAVVEGEDERHHGKKSVLKKVKAKAKKIKETLKKHGHGHEHDHDYHHDDQIHDEKKDEDEEMEEDPEVHVAPMYESPAVRSVGAGQQPGVNLEEPTVTVEDRYDSKIGDPPTRPTAVVEAHVPEDRRVSFSPGAYGNKVSESTGNCLHGKEENMGQPRVNMGTPAALEEDLHAPKDRAEESNYHSKVIDPTSAGETKVSTTNATQNRGGEEAGITPILRSFNKMSAYDEPKPEVLPELNVGSQDHFYLEPLPANTSTNPEDSGSALKSFGSGKPEDHSARDNFAKQPSDQSGHTDKVPSATSAIAVKNVVASKLDYGENERTREGEESENSAEHGRKIAATVTEKPESLTGQARENKGPDKGVSVKEYSAEKLGPSDEDKALSEVISDALHNQKQEPEAAESKPVGKVNESEAAAARQLGKVNESEAAARQLGPTVEDEGTDSGVAANVSATGKAVVDSIKGTVSSWFGMGSGDQSQNSQASLGTSGEVGHGQNGVG